MPIYEYQCDGCGEVFEATQRITEPPLKKHAACGSKKVKRLISQTSFQLKGSGWYVTDYAGKKTSDDTGDSKPKADKTETKADTKADKSDTKADTKAEKKSEKKKGKAA